MEDHHVDRPDVEARQRVQLTGTNRSFDLIVLIIKERARKRAPVLLQLRPLPAWWLLRGDKTRSHPELGRQTPQRQWYFVSRHGRVGRRQACKERKTED